MLAGYCKNGAHINYHGPCECTSDCDGKAYDWSRDDVANPDQDIYSMALGLRSSVDGSADPMPDYEEEKVVQVLVSRLHFWKPSHFWGQDFDDAMKLLIKAALREYADRLLCRTFKKPYEPGIAEKLGYYIDLNATK